MSNDWSDVAQKILAAVPQGADKQQAKYRLHLEPTASMLAEFRETAQHDEFAAIMFGFMRDQFDGRGLVGIL